jgi:hypothetical protein
MVAPLAWMALTTFIGALGTAIGQPLWNRLKAYLWRNRKKIVMNELRRMIGMEHFDMTSRAFWELDQTLDEDLELDEADISRAISQKLQIKEKLGIELTNIFDRDAIKADINKLALARVNFLLGADPENPIIESFNKDSMRSNLRGFFGKQAVMAIESGSSGFIGAADVSRIVDAAMTYERHYEKYKADPAKPVINTPDAASNRSRQAKYRANHTRHWEPK